MTLTGSDERITRGRSLRLGALLTLLGGVGALATPFGCDSSSKGGSLPTDGSGGSGPGQPNGGAGSPGQGGETNDPTQPTGFGATCQSDRDCRQHQLLCDLEEERCVECVLVSDCPEPAEGEEAICQRGRCEVIVPCLNSLDCPDHQVCDRDAGYCVECVGDNDCSEGELCSQQECVPGTRCADSADCSGGLLCDTSAERCVECVTESDCVADERCASGTCVPVAGCDKPRVALLIPRSGAMFEAGFWEAVSEALVGEDGIVARYQDQVDLSVSFYYREEGEASCPLFHRTITATPANVESLIVEAGQAHASATSDSLKIDAPIPEAITETAGALSGADFPTIVLLATSMPDSCATVDHYCNLVPVIASAQAAYSAGVRTFALGLNTTFEHRAVMLQGLANAGVGEPVANPGASYGCPDFDQPSYSSTNGSAPYYEAQQSDQVAGELEAIFERLVAECTP